MKSSDSGRTKSTTGSSSGQKACGGRGFSLPEVAKTAAAAMHNAQIEQFKFLRVVCAWTYLKKSLNIFDITYFYPNANNPEENRENSIFVNLTL